MDDGRRTRLPGLIGARIVGASVIGIWAVLLGSCDGGSGGKKAEAAKPKTFDVRAGAADPDAPADLAAFGFYPSTVKVHPGDRLRFGNGSGMVPIPHTVTLGKGMDIPGRLPPPLVPGIGQVPAVWGRCVSAEAIDPAATDCPSGTNSPFPPSETMRMPAFAGQQFYNSGIFDQPQMIEMPIAADAPTGSYAFFCYLHPATMDLTVEIVAAEEPTQTQAAVDEEATRQIDQDVADGLAAASSADQAPRPAGTVQAGAEQGKAVVTRFFPSTVTVKAGETVTWANEGFDPHVVAMGKAVSPHAPENFAPPTLPAGGEYRSGDVISGLFGNPPFPTKSYAIRFPDPGRYAFFCPIHPGMAGIVVVTPG